MRRAHLAWLVAGLGACSKAGAEKVPEPVASAAAAAAPSAAAARPSPVPTTWRGSYESAAAVLYIPADWKGVHWKVTDTPTGIGEGAIELSIDPSTGGVRGTLTGVLGPASLRGQAADGRVTATIARDDPGDRGFAGTLAATLAGQRAEGTLSVSLADAAAIRAGTFTLAPGGAREMAR